MTRHLMTAALLVAAIGCMGGCSTPVAPDPAPAATPQYGVTVEITPETLALDCGTPPNFQPGSCLTTFHVSITNGTDEALTIDRIDLQQLTGGLKYYSFDDSTVPARGTWSPSRRLSVALEGAYRLTVHLRGSLLEVSRGFDVTSPQLEAAKERCRACDGVFGSWGMTSHIGCNCRNADRGEPCNDGRDCLGDCLAGSDPPAGFAGRCAEHVTTFGCHGVIPDGWRDQPPPRRAHMICVD